MPPQTVPSLLELLWRQGFFRVERLFKDIMKKLGDLGAHPTRQNLNGAISHAKFLTKRGKVGSRRYIHKNDSSGRASEQDLLPEELIKVLKRDFEVELKDLRHNFGVSGTCSAFLIRKILEKLIFITFSKNHHSSHLRDASGKQLGLHALLKLAPSLTVGGKPYLTKRTLEQIQPIKFLGDASAHNPLVNVPMKTIEKEMAYIIIAYSELATKL